MRSLDEEVCVITPFRVEIPDSVLHDLRDRLTRTRWPDQLPDTGWEYGTDLAYLRQLCQYWADGYDWRAAESRLNAWDQVLVPIDGEQIHAIHARSSEPSAIPLLVMHGWPGSVAEMMHIIDPLRDPAAHGGSAADAFHVICPSLPGFGFSGPTSSRGWKPSRVAAAMSNLMQELGYERYGVHGGDWGATTANYLGVSVPEELLGIHLTMVAAAPPDGFDFTTLSADEQRMVAESAAFFEQEAGYQQMQGTRPQTVAYGLNDSPAGLAGWIVEKFRAWSDCDGDVESAISRDDMLNDITVYWVTRTANSAARIYYEAMHGGEYVPLTQRIEVPTGCALFPKETVRAPRAWADAAWNIRRWTPMERGGHFPALEQPQALVNDIRAFYRDLR
jgi:microsomal epoxide hydrolase